jgi:hypothetical protein
MIDKDDAALDAALAQALGPRADDTAPLSRAVLSRIAMETAPPRPPLSEVLAQPAPATGLLLGGLLLAGALGYALLPGEVEDLLLLQALIGLGG